MVCHEVIEKGNFQKKKIHYHFQDKKESQMMKNLFETRQL